MLIGLTDNQDGTILISLPVLLIEQIIYHSYKSCCIELANQEPKSTRSTGQLTFCAVESCNLWSTATLHSTDSSVCRGNGITPAVFLSVFWEWGWGPLNW